MKEPSLGPRDDPRSPHILLFSSRAPCSISNGFGAESALDDEI
jgi:hypothetical protein